MATIVQIVWMKLRHGKVDGTMIASGLIIVVFGGATLLLHDENFIKWKPTVLYWVFSVALIVANLVFKKNLIRGLMEKQISLPNNIWNNLNLAWSLFFLVLGFVNLYVAFNYSTDHWVDFKLFGTTALMFIFIIAQGLILNKYITEESPK